jgi:predicted Zn finger-like uncharacterized protein
MSGFTCPHCGAALRVPSRTPGDRGRVRCPRCDNPLKYTVLGPGSAREQTELYVPEAPPGAADAPADDAGGDMPEAPPRRLQPATKVALAVILGCLLLGCGGGLTLLLQTAPWREGGASGPGHERRKPDLTVSAQSLFTAYCEGVAGADQTYNGKLLEVSGTVASVGSDARGPYLIFAVVRPHRGGPVSLNEAWARIAEASASGVQGVRCYFPKERGPDVRQGQDIILRGRCAGMPLDVELRDCGLVP